MTTDRTFVILMTFLLMMSGCFGATSNADAEEDPIDDSTESQTNQSSIEHENIAPIISTLVYSNANFYNGVDCMTQGVELEVRHAMTDWDGNIVSAGWDINLDGNIDFPVSNPEGYTLLQIPQAEMIQVTIGASEYLQRSIVFGALDDDGSWSSSELFLIQERLGYFSNSNNSSPTFVYDSNYDHEPCSDFTNPASYTFSVTDHPGNVSGNNSDYLVEITRTNGNLGLDLDRVAVIISDNYVSLPNSVSFTGCADNTQGTFSCQIIEPSSSIDSLWDVNETITLAEGDYHGARHIADENNNGMLIGIYIDGLLVHYQGITLT